MIELVQLITNARDIEQLQKTASRVVGETCWRATLSYGDELTLHLGEHVSYPQPSMAGKKKGAWIVGTRGTAWQLEQPTGTILLSDAEPEILKQGIHQLEGHVLTSLNIGYPALSLILSFSENYYLTVIPSSSDDDFDLPYWELFTPEHQVLQVGPKARWSLMQSNQKGLARQQEN